MKKVRLQTILILGIILLITGCQTNLEQITYHELMNKINKKDTFIIEITQNNCSHCEEFSPRLKTILETNKIKAYNLNLSNISEDDYNKLAKDYNVSGTPTTMFFKEGKELINNRINGSISDKKIINILKRLNYIKK